MRHFAALSTLVLLWLTLVSAAALADGPTDQSGKQDSTVSPLLQQFIQEREDSEGPQAASDSVVRGQSASSEATTKDSTGSAGNYATTKDATRSAGSSPNPASSTDDPVRFDSSGNVQVYIHLENTDESTLQQLRDLGATVEVFNSDWHIVQAWVPISALDQIADLDAVQEITPPDYGVTKTGSINTEGDAMHRADLVRTFSGLTGKGVRVGVISNGVDSWRTARGKGDLPSALQVNPDLPGGGDEGTALLEIIHDLAPEADLAFSGAETSLRFVEAALWLANDAFGGEGADIIVDDIGYYREPFFEDGLVALAAADAVAGGAVFVSAAGNNANKHYEGQFSNDGNGYHDFDSSSATDIALRIGVGRSVILQWNDEFGSSRNDYDLFLCPLGLKPIKFNLQNDVCEGSTRGQDGNDNPYEGIFTRFSDLSVADVYIRKYVDSDEDKTLKLFVLGGAVLEHGVLEGGIFGHPAVSEVLAVGAIRASEPGNDAPEAFSDRGPAEIYFPDKETRNKPDVMGIDGVLVTGSGGFGRPVVGSSGRLFSGTSAAAPHVAGIAALVMEAQRLADPSMTKKEVADSVTQRLRDTAIDVGETGHDNATGHGRADALAAIESIAESSTSFDMDSRTPFPDKYTVDSTGDGADDDTSDGACDDGNGNCTLRAAIQQANAVNGTVIKFNISGGGTRTIQPASALPTITQPVFIDGYSQPGASAGTVLIELDGTNAGLGVDGLTLTGNGSYLRGLAVNSFKGNGVVMQGSSGGQVLLATASAPVLVATLTRATGQPASTLTARPMSCCGKMVISGNDSYGVHISGSGAQRAVIYGNTIGLNAAGTTDLGNSSAGVYIDGASYAALRDNVISGNDSHGVSLSGSGGTNADILANKIGVNASATSGLGNTGAGVHISGVRNVGIYKNVIAGNESHGVDLTGPGTYDIYVAENYIGTNASGTALGNGGSGVHIGESARDNTVEGNTIANSGGDGVAIISNGSTGNTVWENSIHSNTGHGIDLGDDGVTENDDGDTDSGPNFLQNFPTDLTFATRDGVASARFGLEVTANRVYIIDYYSSDSCDSAGNGEGKQWLGFSPALGSRTGNLSFTASTLQHSIGSYTAPSGTHITATATDTVTNSTSEFSTCVAPVPLPTLVISVDTVEATEDAATAATYTVALPSAPSADTKVILSVSDDSVATISTTEITFTTTDWSEDVTVTPVSDDDPLNETTDVLHLVSIGDHEFPTALLPVEVTDDDALGLTLTSTAAEATFPTVAEVAVGVQLLQPLAISTSVLRPGTFLMRLGSTSITWRPRSSSTPNSGIQYTPVDSMTTVSTRHSSSQSAKRYRSAVKAANSRTGSSARSEGTATKWLVAPTSMPAAFRFSRDSPSGSAWLLRLFIIDSTVAA